MRKEKPHCLICKYVKHTKPDENGKQDSCCKLSNILLPRTDVFDKVDCTKYERIPVTCASCGADIVNARKADNPLRYRSGKNKGKVKPCCDAPDWRVCPNPNCEADGALICKNCGWYYGLITW